MAEQSVQNDNEQQKTEAPRPPAKRRGLAGEFMEYLMENKKWWMIPIIITFLLLALILVLGSTTVAPFIYTIF
ncbi:hypothetical protein HQ520_10115 [bacterium]|nr:hypothetical protein [bacterium]